MTNLASLTAAASTITHVSDRSVSGILVPYGPIGYTSAGPVVVPGPGRLALPPPDQFGRIKLVDEHRDPPVAIGYLTDVRDTPEGLRGRFYVGDTDDGNRALSQVRERVRDAFSVELVDLDLTYDGEVTAATVSAVALVAVPAWADAREDGLAASHTTMKGSKVTEEERNRLAALLAQTDRTDDENGELRDLLVKASPDPVVPDTEEPSPADEEEAPPAQAAASLRQPARVPAGVPAGGRTSKRHTVRDLAAAQARVLTGKSRPEMEAALLDITNTANIWTAPDTFGGELWSGVEYQRRYVSLLLPGDLPSYKGSGWKWTTKPEVDDYAGDKTAVPSNQPVTVATSWTAARLAGGHDIDRKYFDFGDTDFIESYYRAMRESYAIQSDGKALAFILANDVSAGAAGLTIWHAAAKAAQAVFDATGGRTPDYFLVNSADVLGLVGTASADMPSPEVLEIFGVTSSKFHMATGVAAGEVVAGIREAGRFRELAGSPIRVEAINVANGGIDGGLFGYYATEETFEGGIQSATFDATP